MNSGEPIDSKDTAYRLEGSDKMSEDQDLIELEQKAFKEIAQDGLNIIWTGMFLLILSGIFSQPYWSEILPLHIGAWLGLLFPILLVPVLLIGTRLKERFTYPRIGYVKPRDVEPKYNVAMLLPVALVFIVIIAFLILSFGSSFDIEMAYRFMPLYFGLVMVVPSLMLVKKTGNRIYSLQGILMSMTGFVFGVTDFGESRLGFILYMLLWGSILTLVGLILFVRFIKNNPVITALEDADSE